MDPETAAKDDPTDLIELRADDLYLDWMTELGLGGHVKDCGWDTADFVQYGGGTLWVGVANKAYEQSFEEYTDRGK